MNPTTPSPNWRARLQKPRNRRTLALGIAGAALLSVAVVPAALAEDPPSVSSTLTTLAQARVVASTVVAPSAPATAPLPAPAPLVSEPIAPAVPVPSAVPAPAAPTAGEQAAAALAAATPEQVAAFRLMFMTDAERAAFKKFLAPPPPPVVVPRVPAPAPAPAFEPESAPASEPDAPAGPFAPAPDPARAAIWDRLAQCESGGNWQINTGNGYQGGVQFHPGTWNSMGGRAYAPGAHLASREQQIDIAERVAAAAGGSFRAWPGCRAKLGLP